MKVLIPATVKVICTCAPYNNAVVFSGCYVFSGSSCERSYERSLGNIVYAQPDEQTYDLLHVGMYDINQ